MFKKKKNLFIYFNFFRFIYNNKLKGFKRWDIYKNYNMFKYKNTENNLKCDYILDNNRDNFILHILYKNKTAKAVLSFYKIIMTLSIGSVLNFLKLRIKKSLRRSLSGLNVFLNYLKKVFFKNFFFEKVKNILFSISGFDNRLLMLRKRIYSNILKKDDISSFFIFFILNLKVDFCKKKNKKIKSIKKRLRKKILINFLKFVKK